jgi:hypothetical protein
MEHFFKLPVLFEGAELNYNTRLVTFGYTYKFYVMIEGRELVFEKDDEGNYRVVSEDPRLNIDPRLLQSVITSLTTIER